MEVALCGGCSVFAVVKRTFRLVSVGVGVCVCLFFCFENVDFSSLVF